MLKTQTNSIASLEGHISQLKEQIHKLESLNTTISETKNACELDIGSLKQQIGTKELQIDEQSIQIESLTKEKLKYEEEIYQFTQDIESHRLLIETSR